LIAPASFLAAMPNSYGRYNHRAGDGGQCHFLSLAVAMMYEQAIQI
jgi:hypothetical protein